MGAQSVVTAFFQLSGPDDEGQVTRRMPVQFCIFVGVDHGL